jgi:hypothetical protein
LTDVYGGVNKRGRMGNVEFKTFADRFLAILKIISNTNEPPHRIIESPFWQRLIDDPNGEQGTIAHHKKLNDARKSKKDTKKLAKTPAENQEEINGEEKEELDEEQACSPEKRACTKKMGNTCTSRLQIPVFLISNVIQPR